jgi:hypothetical protein
LALRPSWHNAKGGMTPEGHRPAAPNLPLAACHSLPAARYVPLATPFVIRPSWLVIRHFP